LSPAAHEMSVARDRIGSETFQGVLNVLPLPMPLTTPMPILLARDRSENRLKVLDPARKLLMPLQNCLLGGLKNAIQAANDREREDHLAVLRLLVVPAQKVSHAPDEGRVIPDRLTIGHD
jgi:hypothetical protein